MNKSKFGLIVIALLAFLGTTCKNADVKKPVNVIILLIDDMGYGDIAAHGNPVIKTPNFDALHDQSARFTNFAVSPTCSPTRAALLTGKHEFLSGVTHTLEPMRDMDPESTTLAELFQKAEYKTGLFGKWHLGQKEKYGPWFRGFDETLTVPGDDQSYHFDPVFLKNRVEKKYTGYREDILFSEAMKFITENRDSSFFCYLATYSPHKPNIVPRKYTDPYESFRNTSSQGNLFIPEFFGQIANIDENLGKLLAHLQTLELMDNTLLIILNDNGGTLGVDTFNGGRRGVKATSWSGGTHAYCFWKWGDHYQPGERNQMCGHIDILPTLADLCNLEIPTTLQVQMEGSSIRPALEDPQAELDKDRMQVHHVGRWDIPENWADHKYANSCVRWGKYTLVRIEPCKDPECVTCSRALMRGHENVNLAYTNNSDHYALTSPGKWELYNIENDPFQSNDIADENPEIVEKMSDYYEKWWAKVEKVMNAKW